MTGYISQIKIALHFTLPKEVLKWPHRKHVQGATQLEQFINKWPSGVISSSLIRDSNSLESKQSCILFPGRICHRNSPTERWRSSLNTARIASSWHLCFVLLVAHSTRFLQFFHEFSPNESPCHTVFPPPFSVGRASSNPLSGISACCLLQLCA